MFNLNKMDPLYRNLLLLNLMCVFTMVTSQCNTPPSVSNAVYTPTGPFTVYGEIKYVCDTGYYVTSGNAVLTCRSDGRWSGTSPHCSRCSNNAVGYENQKVDLKFNIDVTNSGNTFLTYKISRYNGAKSTTHLIAFYGAGASFGHQGYNGVEFIGLSYAGDLTIRIGSMNRTFEGLYVLEQAPSGENNTCINLVFRACSNNEAGYESLPVELVFNIDVPNNNSTRTFTISRYNGVNITTHLIAVYDEGRFGHQGFNGVEIIGNTSAGNLTIRIPSMSRAFEGLYILERSNPFKNIACTHLMFRDIPEVLVVTTNATVNDSSAIIKCAIPGRPSSYSEWRHIWPGYGIVRLYNRLGSDPILTLSPLTYEFSGIYNCLVGFAIPGIGNFEQYATIYLQVDTFPVITTASPKQLFDELHDVVVVLVDFYSNRDDNRVECFRASVTVNCTSQILEGDIILPVFGTMIQTRGSIAKITFTIQQPDQYGQYTIKISNAIGGTTVDVELVPADLGEEVKSTTQSNTGVVIGVSVAGLIGILIGVTVVLVWMRLLRKKNVPTTGQSRSDTSGPGIESPSQVTNTGITLENEGVYYNIDRNTYSEIYERRENSHDYGTLDIQNENDTDSAGLEISTGPQVRDHQIF